MFWELYQQSNIHAANSAANRARSSANRASRQAERLEEKVDALALTCQALWEIVREDRNLTEDHLLAKIEQINLRHGWSDGRTR